jgi:serine/threonine protein kinase
MEFADGVTIQEKINQILSQNQILEILVQILEGLYYLYNRKIVHRDLKPQNILVENEQVNIADFGISRYTERGFASKFTFEGIAPFMSPEMYLNEPMIRSADICSVIVIAYYLPNRKLPFYSSNINVLKELILSSNPNHFLKNFRINFRIICCKC